jgi:hypothetical protein
MDIFYDNRLPDYFRERRWADVRERRFGEDSVLGDFLHERIGVIWGYDLSNLDLDFLGGLSFPQTWQFKKLNAVDLISPSGAATGEAVLHQGFGGDRGKFQHFVEQVRHLTRIAEELIGAILPRPPDSMAGLTRFSETRMENLHCDVDKSSDDHEGLRLYINLDKAPRLWATSYQMSELVRGGGRRLIDGLDPTAPAETLVSNVIKRAYGGWHQRATERTSPRHFVYIDPGDIFVIDGRSVSHQVMCGQRVFNVYAKLSHATNPEVRPTFSQKLRQAFSAAANVPLGSETALVSYYNSLQIKGAGNLRENWADVFGNTRTGRIRRFDDSGLAEEK